MTNEIDKEIQGFRNFLIAYQEKGFNIEKEDVKQGVRYLLTKANDTTITIEITFEDVSLSETPISSNLNDSKKQSEENTVHINLTVNSKDSGEKNIFEAFSFYTGISISNENIIYGNQ